MFDTFRVEIHGIWNRYPGYLWVESESDFDDANDDDESCQTSQHLLDGLAQTLVQTFVDPYPLSFAPALYHEFDMCCLSECIRNIIIALKFSIHYFTPSPVLVCCMSRQQCYIYLGTTILTFGLNVHEMIN